MTRAGRAVRSRNRPGAARDASSFPVMYGGVRWVEVARPGPVVEFTGTQAIHGTFERQNYV